MDSDRPETDYNLQDNDFAGMDQQEHITKGALVSEADQPCERCGDPMDVGDRTFLIGRVSGADVCCEYCAFADGAGDHILE